MPINIACALNICAVHAHTHIYKIRFIISLNILQQQWKERKKKRKYKCFILFLVKPICIRNEKYQEGKIRRKCIKKNKKRENKS